MTNKTLTSQDGTGGQSAFLTADEHRVKKERVRILESEPLDDPLNISPENRVRYFRENLFPYAHRMRTREYNAQKLPLQVELVKLQNWMRDAGERAIILFEGRDAAGKGGTIRRFMEHWNPRTARVSWLWTSRLKWRWASGTSNATSATSPRLARSFSVRSVMVQPRRGREGHGLLHRRGVPAVHTAGSAA